MFDGNHRSRRTVNLSGRKARGPRGGSSSSSSGSASNRTALLEQTRRLREERQAQQQRHAAARCIQCHVRGAQKRRQIQQQLVASLLAGTDTANTTRRGTTQLNFVLRLLLSKKHKKADEHDDLIQKLLFQLASQLPDTNTAVARDTDSSSSAPLLAHRIFQQTCRLLVRSSGKRMDPALASRILQFCLPTSPSTTKTTAAAQNNSSWTLLGGTEGFLVLCETVVSSWEQKHETESNALSFLSLNLWLTQYLTETLQSMQSQPTPSQSTEQTWGLHALWGVLEWSRYRFYQRMKQGGAQHTQSGSVELPSPTSMAAMVRALVDVKSNDSTASVTSPFWWAIAATKRFMQHQQAELLWEALSGSGENNLPSFLPVSSMVRLLAVVLAQSPTLLHYSQQHVLNDKLPTTRQQQQQQMNVSDDAMAVDDDEDDEDEDDEEWRKSRAPSSAANPPSMSATSMPRTTLGLLRKQDLLTVPKIDGLVLQARDQWVRSIQNYTKPHQNDDLLWKLARRIGSAQLWLQWEQTLFAAAHPRTNEEDDEARHSYCLTLAKLLQACTSLRPRTSAMSPFLTKLAFAPSVLERLWRFLLVLTHNSQKKSDKSSTFSISSSRYDISSGPTTSSQNLRDNLQTAQYYTAFSVFCDVFAHQLVALKDDQFLATHTTMDGPKVLLAEHVILHLRLILYELYWLRPVLVHEVPALWNTASSLESFTASNDSPVQDSASAIMAARVRLFLTGTKLWNSLYERWCRLLRHAPFCDESTWWFPSVVSLTHGDGVVDRSGRDSGRGHENRMDDSGEMQVDSDDEDDEDDNMENNAAGDVEGEVLADSFRDPKMARILTSIPQCLPFERRVKLFDALLQAEKTRVQDESSEMHHAMLAMMRGEEPNLSGRVSVEIRRDQLYEDSMRQLNQLGTKLKRKVKVSFINQHGIAEAGIDGGGVFKEFLDDLVKDAFSPNREGNQTNSGSQLFAVTPLETLGVNARYTKDPEYLPHYEFLGRAVGKAVYESLLVDPQFCLPFLNTLLGKSNTLEDLKNFDPEYYRNLTKLMAMNRTDIESTGLTFELAFPGSKDGESIELMPGGAMREVTKENVIQYAHLVSHQLLNVQGARQVKAFLRGFRDLIPAAWVRLFSAYELQKLISGDDTIHGLDVAAFKTSMNYAAGYHPSQPIMEWFWEIVDEMTPDQQCKLLKFMTSCSRQPLLGFSSLDPAPCIQQIRLPDRLFEDAPTTIMKNAPLPTSSTCMNLLKLPNYRSKDLMRAKLLSAIEAGAGFELS